MKKHTPEEWFLIGLMLLDEFIKRTLMGLYKTYNAISNWNFNRNLDERNRKLAEQTPLVTKDEELPNNWTYYYTIVNGLFFIMILPGTTVTVKDPTSIYRGYTGFVQRISGDKAAVLFDNLSPWEKMITFPIKDLHEGGELPKSKFLS